MSGTILRKRAWVVETAALLDHQTPENARLNLEWTSRPGILHIANWANAVDYRPATQQSRFQSCILGSSGSRPRKMARRPREHDCRTSAVEKAPQVPPLFAPGSPEKAATDPGPPLPRSTFRSAKDPFAEAPQEQAKGSFMREDVARGRGGPGPDGRATPSRSPS